MTQDKITTVIISESTKPNKKYQAEVNGKVIHFGAAGYSDFTHHKDPARKDRYIQRHKANYFFLQKVVLLLPVIYRDLSYGINLR